MASPTCRTLSLSLTSTQHGEAGKGNFPQQLCPCPTHTTHTVSAFGRGYHQELLRREEHRGSILVPMVPHPGDRNPIKHEG